MSEVRASGKGRELIKDWQQSADYVRRLEQQLLDAKSREHDARQSLTKWLAPSDARPGERFGIWDRDQHGREVLFEIFIGADGNTLDARFRR